MFKTFVSLLLGHTLYFISLLEPNMSLSTLFPTDLDLLLSQVRCMTVRQQTLYWQLTLQPAVVRCRLNLNLLTTTIVALPSNGIKWQMGFNSAFKGLSCADINVLWDRRSVFSQIGTKVSEQYATSFFRTENRLYSVPLKCLYITANYVVSHSIKL